MNTKKAKRKLDETMPVDKDEGLELSKIGKAPTPASKIPAKAKVPKSALKVATSAPKATAAASKAAKGKSVKVELTHTKCRSYWLVRVMGSSSDGCKTFSYKKTSEKAAKAEAKAHCIMVCKNLGAELPSCC